MILVVVSFGGFGCVIHRTTDVSELVRELELQEARTRAARARLGVSQDPYVAPRSVASGELDQPDAGLQAPPAILGTVRSGPAELTIQPDCVLQITVAEDPALDGSYPVNEIGAVELGYVGPVILYNRTERQAAAKIEEMLMGRYFRSATVGVKIIRASYDKIRVSGAVNMPGTVRIGAGDTITLNDALLRAGGLRPTVRGAKVRVVRDGLTTAVAPALEGEVYSLMTDEGMPNVPNVILRNNDMAYVFSSQTESGMEVGDKEVLVLGEVGRQGVYRFAGSEPFTMMHLVFKMGSFPPYANTRAIRIIRVDKDGRETEQEVNVQKILTDGDPSKDISLEHGDRIVVPARRLTLF